MLWVFKNFDKTVRVETRYDSGTAQYVMIVRWPEGAEQVERFDNVESFRQRLHALEEQFTREQFKQVGGPIVITHQWSNTEPTNH